MPDRPLAPSVLKAYADPAYLSPSAPPAEPEDGRSLYRKVGLPALIGGNVADIATTLQALHAGRAREANPLMGQGGAGMVAMKAGTTAAEALLLDRLAKHHKTAALLASLGIGAAELGLAAHNHGVGR